MRRRQDAFRALFQQPGQPGGGVPHRRQAGAGGQHRLASGARYVGGRYEWWTKGEEGTLRDLMQAENAAPALANCHAKP
ncbi:MliC family protein [Cupriavidus necator]|uniref:MliC family protein n=1 Tax=Cupriavidus necator TaxID=106590 RepID=UPI0023ECE953|nr:MliC family protein [Cupriavidus necator]